MSQPGFEINGERLDVPTLESLTLDEEQILYDVAGVVQMDFIRAHPEASDEEKEAVERLILIRVRDPRFKRALAHIAYRRRYPAADFGDVQILVGSMNALDVDLALLGKGDAEDPTTSSPSEHESRSSSNGSSSSEDSGSPSGSDSGEVVDLRASTGTGR